MAAGRPLDVRACWGSGREVSMRKFFRFLADVFTGPLEFGDESVIERYARANSS